MLFVVLHRGTKKVVLRKDTRVISLTSHLTTMNLRVAAILGAGPGNGAAFARKFLGEGYSVAVLSRSAKAMQELATSLGPPDRVKGYSCDVCSNEAVEAAFQQIQSDFGPVSTVIYNAGSGGFKPLEEWEPSEITMAADINAAGLFRAATAALPQLEKNGGGNIVVVGAGAATRGRPMTIGFAAGKAAQRSVAQSLARAWGPKKVHVSYLVIDGMIDGGEKTRSMMPDKPVDFFLQSDDIAEAIWTTCQQKPSAWTFELDIRPFGETW
jgi:NADP-dependent 3-hydroxy acid dehydrogenase YdfG